MRAAILCRGPSILETFPARTAEPYVTIAVNTAINTWGADWLICHDAAPLESATVAPRIGVCSLAGHLRGLREGRIVAGWGEWSPELKTEETVQIVKALGLKGKAAQGARQWSALGGVALAVHLGAAHVDMYGCDLHGREYEDGTGVPDGPVRWAREGAFLGLLTTALAEKGITVTRIGNVPTTKAAPSPDAPPITMGDLRIPERRAARILFRSELHEARTHAGGLVFTPQMMERVVKATKEGN